MQNNLAKTDCKNEVDLNKVVRLSRQSENGISYALKEFSEDEIKLINDYINASSDNARKYLKDAVLELIMDKHKFAVNQSPDGRWSTYVPDETKPQKRKLIRKTKYEDLQEAVISHYCEKMDCQSKMTLGEAFEKWMIFKRDKECREDKTIKEFMNDWNKFYKDTELENMRLVDISPKIIAQFFREITKTGEYTYTRISNGRSILNGIMAYAIEEDIITHNPVSEVNFRLFNYKPQKNTIDEVFTVEERKKLLNVLENEHTVYAYSIKLFMNMFVRIGELRALKWEDVDWENKKIYIHNQIVSSQKMNDDLTFGERGTKLVNHIKGKTSKGYRYHPLSDAAMEILKRLKQMNPYSEFVLEYKDEPIKPDSFNKALKRYCEQAEVKYRSSHKIRFSNASVARSNNVPISTISKLMGHSMTSTTEHYFRNVQPEEEQFNAVNCLMCDTDKIDNKQQISA